MACQARVLDNEMKFPNGTPYYTSKLCDRKTTRKIKVDVGAFPECPGDPDCLATMYLCTKCMPNYMNKDSSNKEAKAKWLGWFDCDIPPEAHVKHSAWYDAMMKDSATQKALTDAEQTVEAAAAAFEKLAVSEHPQTKPAIKAQIRSLQAWLANEGKTKVEQHKNIHAAIFHLKTAYHFI